MNQVESERQISEVLDIRPTHHRTILYWSLLSQLKGSGHIVLVDIANTYFESIAREHFNNDITRVFSLSLCEKYGYWLASKDHSSEFNDCAATNPIVLGDRNLQLEYQFSNIIDSDLDASKITLRQVTIDSTFGGLNNLTFIYINDVNQVLSILSGAKDAIKLHRPTIAIALLATDEIPNLLEWSRDNSYILLDSHYINVTESSKVSDLLMFPVENISLMKKCRCSFLSYAQCFWGFQSSFNNISQNEIGIDTNNSNYKESYAAPTALLKSFIKNKELIQLDEINCKNWYQMESEEDFRWRWSGPESDSIIFLSVPGPGFYRVKFIVMSVVEDSLWEGIKVFIDGVNLSSELCFTGNGEFSTTFYISEKKFDGIVRVLFSVPMTVRASTDDPRMLGLALQSIGLSWNFDV